MTVYTTLIMI